MSQPQILIDPNEAQRIEKNIILRGIYYRPTGYYSNPKSFDPKPQYSQVGFPLKNFILSEVPSFLTTSQTRFAKDLGLFL